MDNIKMYINYISHANPYGAGAAVVVLVYKNIEREHKFAYSLTTRHRIELISILEGLECLNRPCKVDIYINSAYACAGFRYMPIWSTQGWSRRKGELRNKDIWMKLYEHSQIHRINVIHSDVNIYTEKYKYILLAHGKEEKGSKK